MSHPGWRAVYALAEHDCADCRRYLAAVSRGNHPLLVIWLRCERAQEWQMQAEAMYAGEPDEGYQYLPDPPDGAA